MGGKSLDHERPERTPNATESAAHDAHVALPHPDTSHGTAIYIYATPLTPLAPPQCLGQVVAYKIDAQLYAPKTHVSLHRLSIQGAVPGTGSFPKTSVPRADGASPKSSRAASTPAKDTRVEDPETPARTRRTSSAGLRMFW